MDFAQFLATFGLYRDFKLYGAFHATSEIVEKARAIQAHCNACNAERTFTYSRGSRLLDGMKLLPAPGSGTGFGPEDGSFIRDKILVFNYICLYCNQSERIYFVMIGTDGCVATKVGQYPPWDISVPKALDDMIPKHRDMIKKGLICESHGFGIGAYGYYRRIVELTIDDLLDSIPELLVGEEKEKYQGALERTEGDHRRPGED